jgi:HSP20 family protein
MPITDLIPWKRTEAPSQEEEHALQTKDAPWMTFQQEVNRLFDQFFGESALEPFDVFREGWGGFSPRIDAVETDRELKLSVELPGLDEKEIDVALTREVLTISGEKKQEREEKGRYFRSERSYGAFKRSIALPCDVDTNKVDAVFRNGILTITLPKTGASQTRRTVGIKAK